MSVYILKRVRYEEQHNSTNQSNGLPTLFTFDHAILNRNVVRIAEDGCGLFEGNAMFALIGAILYLIPLKPE